MYALGATKIIILRKMTHRIWLLYL